MGVLFCNAQSTLNNYFSNKKEIYFSFEINNKTEINDFSKTLSIEKIIANQVFAYANKSQFELFLSKNISFDVIESKSNYDIKISKSLKELCEWNSYPTYEQYISLMSQFVAEFPSICSLHEIGESINGRKIIAVKISDNVDQKEAEPEFFYSSSIHGNEPIGYVLSLRLIDYLLHNYTNSDISNLVNNIEIWINPLANPDGMYAAGNHTVAEGTRNNANGVDLNRNYPDPEDGIHPDGYDWQTENIAMMNFMKYHNFVLSANIHSGVETVNYPWDTWAKYHADNTWYQYISRMYADTAQAYGMADYFTDFNNGITNGYEWYTISGGRQDYVNYFLHGREVTLEISSVHLPDSMLLPNYWNYNYKSLLNYIEQSLYGISGVVTDSVTGTPLKAKIEVLSHDVDSSEIYSETINGNYHRLISAGNYSLRISAPKHKSKIIENISVENKQTTFLNVELANDDSYFSTQNRNRFEIKALNNPTKQNVIVFSIISSETTTYSYEIYSTNGRKISTVDNLHLENGDNLLEINIKNFDKGLYIFQFYVADLMFEKKIIKIENN
ncbi:MAG: hypothetical protein A2W98_08450 [Bacteroidetes bacterium GWF2_33_38]|nr:MAG: hypothetical protein A2W98_08450 [Bacteroidetes bacterium GWF2_33_38]OFY68035.1 MAG: hypothetical protein A2265_06740 [Bacteroidetes bacterium RIFOXYA12_FULL_33_9]OFY91297.1 MAG: hypothetical protein A2236_11135 [Bacteroidetes bacterium RIFOXYA2_FULL_33_7]